MDFPKFPYIEVAKNSAEIVENPLAENFLQDFTSHLVNEISKLEISCDKLRNLKRDMQVLNENYLRDVFAITHGKKVDDIWSQQLSKRMQNELGMFRLGEQGVTELLERFHRDYKDWRLSLEQQMQKSLGTDELKFLPQQQLKNKQETLGTIAENAENELNVLEITAEDENTLIDGKLNSLQEEVYKLEELKIEVSTAQQQLTDELKKKQFKYQQETNKLLKEIGSLQKRLELYE